MFSRTRSGCLPHWHDRLYLVKLQSICPEFAAFMQPTCPLVCKVLAVALCLRQRDVEQQTVVAIAKMLERRRQGTGLLETQSATEPFVLEVFWGLNNERFAEVKRKFFRKAAKRERGFRSAGVFLQVCQVFLVHFFASFFSVWRLPGDASVLLG